MRKNTFLLPEPRLVPMRDDDLCVVDIGNGKLEERKEKTSLDLPIRLSPPEGVRQLDRF